MGELEEERKEEEDRKKREDKWRRGFHHDLSNIHSVATVKIYRVQQVQL